MLGSVYGLSWNLSRTEIYVIDIGYEPVFRCGYLFSWVVIGMEISMTWRIWVGYIHCLDYSIHVSRFLLILDNIVLPVKPDWLFFIYIYLTTIMFILLKLLGKYYYTVTTPACLLVTYSCYTGILYLDIYYIPVIPVPWLSHVDIVTVTTTESSQRFK